MLKKLKTFIILPFLFTGLLSCSLAGLGYRYGDWIIKKKIMEIIKLYSPQQKRLEAVLDEYMIWHKKEMLPKYKKEIQNASLRIKEIDNKPLKADEVHDFLLKTRELYDLSFMPLGNRVAPILSELGKEQVERTHELINRRLEKLKAKANLPEKERLSELQETWKDNLKEYLGSISPEQEKLILLHSPRILTSSKARFVRGVGQMKSFLAIYEENPLDAIEDKNKMKVYQKREKELKAFLKNWGKGNHYDTWRKETSLLIAKLSKTLDKKQQAAFNETLKSWQGYVQEMLDD